MSVVLPLFHLREWLCPGEEKNVRKRIQQKPADTRTQEECLYLALDGMKEYRLVKSLCIHARHFECHADPLDGRMNQLQGARFGLMRMGDGFGVTHFMVDDKEVRDIFWPVYKKYLEYFERRSPGIAK